MLKGVYSRISLPRRTLIIFSLLSLIAASLSLAFVAMAEGATVQITSPTDGQSVGSGTVTVSGTVDRSGGKLAAEAGGPYEGEVGSAISLEGSGRGGTPPLSFIWTVQSGPDGASGLFGDATSAVTTFTADTAGSYALQLTTTDSTGAQASDTAAVTVYPPAPASLYLTDVETAQGTSSDCGPSPTYATKADAPTDEASKKAYLGRAFGAFTCGVDFAHETPSKIQLNDSVRFHGWFGCDLPSAAPVDPAFNALGIPINIDVLLTINGEEVPGSRTGWSNGEFVCDGSNVLEIDVTIPAGGVTVPAGDTLALQILPWWVSPTGANDPIENIHLLVDSTTHPSQLELQAGAGAESTEGSSLSGAAINPEPLMLEVGDARPTNSYSIEEAVAIVRQESPDGPILPDHTNADGIGPGSALLINDASLCTAAWLFQDTDDGTYYLSTAGHCLVKDGVSPPVDGSSPVAANRVDICFKDCLVNWSAGLDEFLGIRGDYVTFEQSGSYDPVAFAQAQGIGSDFGLIRIPPSAHELLRPWMPQWGGATGIYSEPLSFEDTAVHFGHGNYCCPGVGAALTRSPVDQGRVAQFHPNLLFSGSNHFEASAGWASGGDSGSAVGRADAARVESKGVLGDSAVGVLTHGLLIGHSGFYGTLLKRGLAMSANFVNNLDLVTEDAVIGEAQGREHIDLYANGELVAGDIAVGPTNDSDPADSWSTEVDFAAYEGQTVELEARWIDRNDTVIDTHTITVSAKEAGAVSITSPTSGQKVGPPFNFEGAFDTSEAGSASASREDAQILRGQSDEPYELISIPGAVRAYQDSPPTGPEAPRAHDGIGPGSAIRMGGFICSAAYLFEDPSTGIYYLSTAGHCLVNDAEDPTPYTGKANPDKVVSAVDICVINCVMNAPQIGLYARVAASGDYHPVTYATSAGIGADFALIEIPRELNGALRPWMPQWGGPTAVETGDFGLESTAVHYGHGNYCCNGVGAVATRAPHDQGRIAQFNFSDADTFEALVGWASGGDSGSGVGKADPSALESMGAIGDTAVGVLTHGLITGGGFFGTRVTKGVSMVKATLPGLQPSLVLQDAVIRSSAPTVELGATIERPADGATIDPGFTPMVTVSGSGTFPAEAGTAPAGTATYFLHRDGCGATGAQPNRLWMDTAQGAVDSGSGCGTLTDPAGFLTSAVWDSGSTVYTFPSTPKPSGELLLGDGVTADIFYSGARGNAALPERGTVITDLEGVLFYGGNNVVARGRMTSTNSTHMAIPLSVENPIVPAGADLTFALIVHGSADIAFPKYGGEFGSRLTLPLVESPARSVQVSVDDPNFGAASLLDVSGTGSWSASWDAASAGVGQHTIYARAIQGESVSPATSVTVNVESAVGPSASFSWTADKRTASFTDQSAERGASIVGWSWDFGDGNTSTEQNPVHTYDNYGTFTVALTVTDSDGNSDTTQQEVTLTAAPWLVEVQLTGPDGRIFGWTEVAVPAEGESGNWSLDWSPETAKSGAYKVEARLLRNGEVLATDAVDFEVIGGKTIRASVVGYSCDSTKWQFIINKIDGGPSAAPSRIQVTWDNGAEEDVPLSNASGKTARYVTTSNLDANVTEAKAFIYEKWNGKFQLGQGPC